MTNCGCDAWALRIRKTFKKTKIGDVELVCNKPMKNACVRMFILIHSYFCFFSFVHTAPLVICLTQKALTVREHKLNLANSNNWLTYNKEQIGKFPFTSFFPLVVASSTSFSSKVLSEFKFSSYTTFTLRIKTFIFYLFRFCERVFLFSNSLIELVK